MPRYVRINLDTAGEQDVFGGLGSHEGVGLGKLMRQRPLSEAERRAVRVTRNGNVVEARHA